MKKLLVLFCIAGFVSLSFIVPTNEDKELFPTLELGENMPMADAELLNVDGESYALGEQAKENGLVVIFSCNTCPFVVAWEDRYNGIARFAEQMNMGYVLINSNEAKRAGDDSFEAMQAHYEEMNYEGLYLVDEDSRVANAFGAKTTPHVFLFNGDSKLVYKGTIDDNYKDKDEVKKQFLRVAMKNAAAGYDVPTPSTTPIGCSIKRVK